MMIKPNLFQQLIFIASVYLDPSIHQSGHPSVRPMNMMNIFRLIFVEPSTLVEKARLSDPTFRRRRRRRPQIFTLWLKFFKF